MYHQYHKICELFLSLKHEVPMQELLISLQLTGTIHAFLKPLKEASLITLDNDK
jgi:hypothetical protein